MQEGTEPARHVALLADGADDPIRVAELPQVQRGHDQLVPVGEVPVEAALGGAQLLGQRLDRDGGEPAREPAPRGRPRSSPRRSTIRAFPWPCPYATVRSILHTEAYGKVRNDRTDPPPRPHHQQRRRPSAPCLVDRAGPARQRRGVPRPSTPLLACTLLHVDWSDAFAVAVPFGARGRPPEAWADAIFRGPPPSVRALFAVRDVLVRLVWHRARHPPRVRLRGVEPRRGLCWASTSAIWPSGRPCSSGRTAWS